MFKRKKVKELPMTDFNTLTPGEFFNVALSGDAPAEPTVEAVPVIDPAWKITDIGGRFLVCHEVNNKTFMVDDEADIPTVIAAIG